MLQPANQNSQFQFCSAAEKHWTCRLYLYQIYVRFERWCSHWAFEWAPYFSVFHIRLPVKYCITPEGTNAVESEQRYPKWNWDPKCQSKEKWKNTETVTDCDSPVAGAVSSVTHIVIVFKLLATAYTSHWVHTERGCQTWNRMTLTCLKHDRILGGIRIYKRWIGNSNWTSNGL